MNGADQLSEPTLVPDLVGRESEFRFLVDSWESARRGHGRTILLTGAAGLGGWHRIRLELTPDGRCALFVDGDLVVRTALAARVPGRVRVLIDGHSVGSRMLVREIDLWSGGR